jgi:hypothetical protein
MLHHQKLGPLWSGLFLGLQLPRCPSASQGRLRIRFLARRYLTPDAKRAGRIPRRAVMARGARQLPLRRRYFDDRPPVTRPITAWSWTSGLFALGPAAFYIC